MSDDIVARLRDYHATVLAAPPYYRELTRIAADEIERLRKQVEHHARDRVEYCDAWSKWIEENDGLDIAEWCRAYADAVPYPNPDGPEIVRVIHSRLDARHRMAADEIERLRADRDEAEPLLEELWQRRTESTEMRAEIERLRAVVEAWLKYSQRAERDIETLRAERDEARRERDGYLDGNRQTLAALAEANEIAKRYKAERDEARKWICQLLANPTSA